MPPEPSQFANSRHIGRKWLHFSAIDSTNSCAATYATDPANHGLVITADVQTNGRGQYQRVWQAPPASSILMSIVLFPAPEYRRAAILTAWAAVSICETIAEVANLEARVKWPNDIVIQGKKICGILCEGGARHVVAGIGMNVNQSERDFKEMKLPDAISLSMIAGRALAVTDLIERLVGRLDANYDLLVKDRLLDLESRWQRGLALTGEDVLIEKMDGSQVSGKLRTLTFAGIEIDLNDDKRVSLLPEAIRQMREEVNKTGAASTHRG